MVNTFTSFILNNEPISICFAKIYIHFHLRTNNHVVFKMWVKHALRRRKAKKQEMPTGSIFDGRFYAEFLDIDCNFYSFTYCLTIIGIVILTVIVFKCNASTRERWYPATSNSLASQRLQKMDKFSSKMIFITTGVIAVFVPFVASYRHKKVANSLIGWIFKDSNALILQITGNHDESFFVLARVVLAFTVYSNLFHLQLQRKTTSFFRFYVPNYEGEFNNNEKWSLRVNCVVEVFKFTVAFVALIGIFLDITKYVFGGIFAFAFFLFHYEILHVWNPICMWNSINYTKLINRVLPMFLTFCLSWYTNKHVS